MSLQGSISGPLENRKSLQDRMLWTRFARHLGQKGSWELLGQGPAAVGMRAKLGRGPYGPLGPLGPLGLFRSHSEWRAIPSGCHFDCKALPGALVARGWEIRDRIQKIRFEHFLVISFQGWDRVPFKQHATWILKMLRPNAL